MTGLSLRDPVEPTLDTVFPLLCITFVLLMFFLVGSGSGSTSAIEVNRPIDRAAGTTGPSIYLRVSGAGTITMQGRRVDLGAAKAALNDMRFELPRSRIVVAAEDGAQASLVFRVLDLCKLSGAGTVRLERVEEPRLP